MRLLTGKHRRQWEDMQAEVATLRERCDYLGRLVTIYKESNTDYDHRCQAERARSDRAVDELLSVRGFAPLTPPTPPPSLSDLLSEDASEVAEIEARLKAGDSSVFAERR